MNNIQTKYGPKALITGGSSGIGKAIALELAKNGIVPILVARNEEKLRQASEEIFKKHKMQTLTYSLDLSDDSEVKALINRVKSEDIGLFVHSAGIENKGFFNKIPKEDELKLIQLNIVSTYLLTHHFSEKMVANKRGGILLISSLFGLMPSPYFSNYAASKSYVHNLGLSLHTELKELGVDVSVLAPGLTDTDMTSESHEIDWERLPMKRMDASKVAEIAVSNLGKKATIIPGAMNKMMGAMAKRVFSMKAFSKMNGKMIGNAIAPNKLY